MKKMMSEKEEESQYIRGACGAESIVDPFYERDAPLSEPNLMGAFEMYERDLLVESHVLETRGVIPPEFISEEEEAP